MRDAGVDDEESIVKVSKGTGKGVHVGPRQHLHDRAIPRPQDHEVAATQRELERDGHGRRQDLVAAEEEGLGQRKALRDDQRRDMQEVQRADEAGSCGARELPPLRAPAPRLRQGQPTFRAGVDDDRAELVEPPPLLLAAVRVEQLHVALARAQNQKGRRHAPPT